MRPVHVGAWVLCAVWASVFTVGARAGNNAWTTAGPPGGDVYALLADPVSASTFYAGTRSGVFKSTDGGQHWVASSSGLANTVQCLAVGIDPSRPLYAGAEAVYKSTDGGGTWVRVWDASVSVAVRSLAVHPTVQGTIYSGSGVGVRISTDGGATWSWSNTGLTSNNVLCLILDPFTPSTLFVGTYDAGVFKSTDGGASWSPCITGLTNLGVNALAADPATPGVFYAGTNAGVFKTLDSGAVWTQPAATGMGFQKVNALAFLPGTPAPLWALTQSSLYKSVDGGANYQQGAFLGYVTGFMAIAASAQAPQTICAGGKTYGIIRTTTGGPDWESANAGLSGTLLFSLAADNQTPSVLYCGGDPGVVYRSGDGGQSWTNANAGLPANIRALTLAADPVTPGTVYLGSDGSGTYKTIDGGETWTTAGSEAPNSVYALAIDPVHPLTVYAGGRLDASNHLKKTTDGGSTWTNVGAGLTGDYVFGVVVDPSSTGTIYAATRGGGVFKSIDGGDTWTPASQGLPVLEVLSIAIDPVVTSTLYAGMSQRPVYKSTDGGATWNATNSGGIPINWGLGLAVDPTAHDTVYALKPGSAVLKTTDGGTTWNAMGTMGPANNAFRSILIEPGRPRRVHVATYGGGVFSYEDCPPMTCSALVPSTGTEGIAVGFAQTSTPGPCSTGSPVVAWDFGDGTAPSSEPSPNHVYATAGTYTWTMTVTVGPETCSRSGSIVISPPCTLACTATALPVGTVGLLVEFAATATGDHCSGSPSFDWDFGDGTAHSSQQEPSHVYTTAGNWTWTMTASLDGLTCIRSGTISIVPPPGVAALKKVAPPFTIVVTGSNLQPGIRVFIDGVEWTSVQYKSAAKIKLTGGKSLKTVVPKGVQKHFRFLNPDGGEAFRDWSY